MYKDFLDNISIASFLIGLANYQENLTQSDKDDIMKHLDQQTRDILGKIHKELEDQNEMLRELLKRTESPMI